MDTKRVVILGVTMFSAEVCEILRRAGTEVAGFTVDTEYLKEDKFCNLPVYPFESIGQYVDVKSVEFVLTIGYSGMNDHRESKYLRCKEMGYNVFTYVSDKAIVYTEKIGEGSLILPGSYVGPFCEIGKCTIIRPGTVLAHHDMIGDFNWLADGCTLGGGVRIDNHCFLGLGTTVRNEINLADYTFTGAQTYVGHDTEKLKAYIGVPAREIKSKTSYDVITKVL